MRVADTSALYAAFVGGDAHHAKAKAHLEDPEPILVPTEILAETVALWQLRHGFDFARAAGAFLRSLEHVRLDGASPSRAVEAWREFESARGRLSLPDAFVVAWCRAEGATPLSFDQNILRRVN